MGNHILEVKNIKKHYGSTIALSDVSLKMKTGRILGLVGENGSGKSTLTSIIAGIVAANEGEIFFKGDLWQPSSMIEALKGGVGMIVQENGTVAGISVAENIFLGESERFSYTKDSPFRALNIINKKAMVEAANEAMQSIGIHHIEAARTTGEFNLQDRKLIELAKVMNKNPEVLIVDETTTALSQTGRDILFSLMKRLRDEGKLVIFISHDLDEVQKYCDELAVLRDGQLIVTLEGDEITEEVIKTSMIGRELTGHYYRDDYQCHYEEQIMLSMNEVTLGDVLNKINLNLHKGEILGIGGLSHCGMHEVGKIAFGAIKPTEGTMKVKNHTIKNELEAMRLKVGYVAKDRDTESLNLEASIRDNIAVAGYDQFEVAGGVINPVAEKKYVNEQVEALSVKCREINQPVSDLSGGNKQKVVFGKWFGRGSEILVLDCPTRGVDIGVKQAMYQQMNAMKKEGKAILMISEELTELIGMSDRIMIMKDGSIAKTFERSADLSEADLITYMV